MVSPRVLRAGRLTPVALEALSRPFGRSWKDPKGRRSHVAEEATEPGPGVLIIESQVRMDVVTVRGMGWSIRKEEREISRETSTVRVTNPSDPSQFVDVERVESLLVRDLYGRTYTLTLVNQP